MSLKRIQAVARALGGCPLLVDGRGLISGLSLALSLRAVVQIASDPEAEFIGSKTMGSDVCTPYWMPVVATIIVPWHPSPWGSFVGAAWRPVTHTCHLVC